MAQWDSTKKGCLSALVLLLVSVDTDGLVIGHYNRVRIQASRCAGVSYLRHIICSRKLSAERQEARCAS